MALSMLTRKATSSRTFMGRKVAAVSNGSMRVTMKAGNWLPGSDTPAYLENLPGSFGFDPLGLGKDADSLQQFREAELIHCRWSMLAVAGCLLPEILGYGDWYQATQWGVTGSGKPTWFGIENPIQDVTTLLVISHVMFAVSEALRNDNQDKARRLYPGGAFDPLGFSKDAKSFEVYQLKEIKNGRLAMVAFLGFVAQHAATGKGPIAALGEHISNPWATNFATNGVSVPFF